MMATEAAAAVWKRRKGEKGAEVKLRFSFSPLSLFSFSGIELVLTRR